MDVVLCSSRGKHLEKELRSLHPSPHRLHVMFKPGASLEYLFNHAKTLLEREECPDRFHIYFMAGICDLTEKVRDLAWVKDYKGRIIQAPYEEVIFTESWKDTPAIFIDKLTDLCDEIIELRAKPSIMTIPTISIPNWNETRLNQYKTCHLLHHQQYPDMQENLNKTLWEVNRLIIEKNIGNKMFTPKIASSIMVNQGPNKPPRTHYSRFTDGVHQKYHITKSWAAQINDSIKINRKTNARTPPAATLPKPDSETDSDSDQPAKRKWKD